MFGLNQAPQECHVYFESAQSREGPFGCEQSGTRQEGSTYQESWDLEEAHECLAKKGKMEKRI